MNTTHRIRSVALAAVLGAAPAALLLAHRPAQAADAGSLAGASVQVDGARQAYEKAMARLVTARQAAMRLASAEPEYRRAAERVQQTYAAYMSSRKNTTEQAQATPQYQELLKQKQALEAELDKLRKSPTAKIEQFTELANKKLAIAGQMRAIEEEANRQAGSPELKKEWQEACRAMEIMDIKTVARCEQQPQVATATKAVEDAEQVLKAAGAQLAGARASYDEEMRQELKADYDQRRSEVMNWNAMRMYGGGTYYYTGRGRR